MDVHTYYLALQEGRIPSELVSGLMGRIIRGKDEEDFLTLSDDPLRQLVMLVGPDGLTSMLTNSAYDMLIKLGHEPEFIHREINAGKRFKLAVFPWKGEALLATWENVVRAVSEVYPVIAERLSQKLGFIQSLRFEEFEMLARHSFAEVDAAGPTDSRYMTYGRLRMRPYINGLDMRMFLYFTVRILELFGGDGHTYSVDGVRGVHEYIFPNCPLTDLGGHQVIDLTVKLPQDGKGKN